MNLIILLGLEARRTNKEMRRQIMKGKVSSKEKKSSENTIPKLENCFELSLSEKFSAPNIRGGRLTVRPEISTSGCHSILLIAY